ncbi:MAG: hypothetical protein ACREO5_13580 [Candidatus Binatia bacterium]
MPTAFSLLRERCSLSLREAADFLAVRPDTVNSWSSGRNPAPAGAIEELRALYKLIETAAEKSLIEIRALIKTQKPGQVEIGIAKSDKEARSLGFPCVGSHAAMIGIVAARLNYPVTVSPRGTTMATNAAVAVHKK